MSSGEYIVNAVQLTLVFGFVFLCVRSWYRLLEKEGIKN